MFATGNVLLKFNGYNARTPQDIRVFFKEELALRDYGGFYYEREENDPDYSGFHMSKRQPRVIGLMPLSEPVQNFDQIQGYFPAISIWQSSKRYTPSQTYSYGYRKTISIDQAFIDSIRADLPMGKREEYMILTDGQLDKMQTRITQLGSLKAEIKGKWKEESVKVQIWTHEEEEDANLLADFTDGILQDLGEIAGPKLRNFNISEEWGHTNFTYGRPLFGIEKNLTFTNYYWTITVYDQAGTVGQSWLPVSSNMEYKAFYEEAYDARTREALSGVKP